MGGGRKGKEGEGKGVGERGKGVREAEGGGQREIKGEEERGGLELLDTYIYSPDSRSH